MASQGPTQHVVVIFKENHTFDNYFGILPGANGAVMAHSPNPPTHDPDHRHKAWCDTPHVLPPVTVNLPGKQGLAFGFGGCGPLAIVDFDVMLRQVFNKLLASEGANIDSSKFPIFLFYNTVMATNSSGGSNCCILGFHNAVTQNAAVAPNKAARVQTHAFIDFDASGAFGPTIKDTTIAAHEVGEWMVDPFGNNPTPAWGHTGQVGACQGNLEVGDPLTGTNIPLVTGLNGYAYHLQELAFFSWFYGAPSIAVNTNTFSDNDTFTTDAGPVCTKH
jgi:hypothetical protein